MKIYQIIKTQDRKLRQISKECDKAIDRVEVLVNENAELNDFIMQSKKDGISPINALIIKNLVNQLTKAKEIIKYLLSFIQKENYKTRWDINITDAEDFIKE